MQVSSGSEVMKQKSAEPAEAVHQLRVVGQRAEDVERQHPLELAVSGRDSGLVKFLGRHTGFPLA